MVSDFRKKKLLRVFHTFFDIDKSGSVNKKDFEQAAKKIAELKGLTPDDPYYKQIEDGHLKIWSILQNRGDSDDDGEISQDEWIAMWDDFTKNPSEAPEWQNLYCKFVFKMVDSGNDGVIDEAEFTAMYAAYGLNKENASEAFKKASSGKDTVSYEEFQELWKQFFLSEDPELPGNFIFGKF